MYQTTVSLANVDDVKSFVAAAMQCPYEVDLVSERYVIDAKSIMGVFSLPLANPLTLKANIDREKIIDFLQKIEPFIVKE